MTRHPDSIQGKSETPPDEEIDDRQADRNPCAAIDHSIEIAVIGFVVILGVPTESLFGKKVAIQSLDGFFSRHPAPHPITDLRRHFIELASVDLLIEARERIPRDQ